MFFWCFYFLFFWAFLKVLLGTILYFSSRILNQIQAVWILERFLFASLSNKGPCLRLFVSIGLANPSLKRVRCGLEGANHFFPYIPPRTFAEWFFEFTFSAG